MRTTLTLDPDVADALERLRREHGVPFRRIVNDALRRGLRTDQENELFDFPTLRLGQPSLDLTHANRTASDLEDDELIAKIHRAS